MTMDPEGQSALDQAQKLADKLWDEADNEGLTFNQDAPEYRTEAGSAEVPLADDEPERPPAQTSTPTEMYGLLDAETADVVERIGGVRDHLTLVGLHMAESQGRKRRKVLAELEARGLEIEMNVLAPPPELLKQVAEALASAHSARPVSQDLPSDLENEDRYPVPGQADFYSIEDGRTWAYMVARDLTEMASHLVIEHPYELGVVERFEVEYLWKRSGGGNVHHATLGKARKQNDHAQFHSATHFVVWLAADNLEGMAATYRQVKATLYHEMKHIGMTEKGGAAIVPHDAELFTQELEHFGAWRSNLRPLVEQLGLPF